MKPMSPPRDRRRMRVSFGTVLATGMCVSFSLISSTCAQIFGSSFTSTARKDCRVVSGAAGIGDSSTRECPGKAGLLVLVTEGDLRETVSLGRTRAAAAKEPAAQARFGPFNSSATKLEWRTVDGRPYAIIQRWLIADISDEDKNGRPKAKTLLVVSRLPPGPVCHVAYVDVEANPNANEIARKAADRTARGFSCGQDKVNVVGESGRAVELATGR